MRSYLDIVNDALKKLGQCPVNPDNFIPVRSGPIFKRPGMQYVGEVVDGAEPVYAKAYSYETPEILKPKRKYMFFTKATKKRIMDYIDELFKTTQTLKNQREADGYRMDRIELQLKELKTWKTKTIIEANLVKTGWTLTKDYYPTLGSTVLLYILDREGNAKDLFTESFSADETFRQGASEILGWKKFMRDVPVDPVGKKKRKR